MQSLKLCIVSVSFFLFMITSCGNTDGSDKEGSGENFRRVWEQPGARVDPRLVNTGALMGVGCAACWLLAFTKAEEWWSTGRHVGPVQEIEIDEVRCRTWARRGSNQTEEITRLLDTGELESRRLVSRKRANPRRGKKSFIEKRSDDGKIIVTGDPDGTVTMWRKETDTRPS